jgi:hypothetical protein
MSLRDTSLYPLQTSTNPKTLLGSTARRLFWVARAEPTFGFVPFVSPVRVCFRFPRFPLLNLCS